MTAILFEVLMKLAPRAFPPGLAVFFTERKKERNQHILEENSCGLHSKQEFINLAKLEINRLVYSTRFSVTDFPKVASPTKVTRPSLLWNIYNVCVTIQCTPRWLLLFYRNFRPCLVAFLRVFC